MTAAVICVYNRPEQFETFLAKSLQYQKGEIEKVFIDNSLKQYASAAAALNYGASQTNADVLVFIHQDIWLKEPDTILKFAEAVLGTDDGDVVGTQGVRDGSGQYYQNLTAGETLNESLVFNYPDELIPVSCFDEGMFGMRRTTWEKHHFDEALCDSWHLYAVEQCLFARKYGNRAFVFPSQIHHLSYGHISIAYMNGLRRLCSVYRRDFKRIWTTCYKVYTNPLYMNGLVLIWKLNRKLRGRSLN